MSDPLEEQEAILEAFFNGSLPEEQRLKLEARMAQEPDFAAEVAMRKEMHQFLRKDSQRQQLKTLLSAIREEEGSSTQSLELKIGGTPSAANKQRRWIPILATAATIALVLLFWFALRPVQLTDFDNPSPLALVEKGSNQSLETQIETSFNTGAYTQAIPLLQEFLNSHPNDPLATLYLGISLFKTRQYPDAIARLQALQDTPSPFLAEAQYWAALAYWQMGEIDKAKALLQKIPSSDTRYQQAQKLLKAL